MNSSNDLSLGSNVDPTTGPSAVIELGAGTGAWIFEQQWGHSQMPGFGVWAFFYPSRWSLLVPNNAVDPKPKTSQNPSHATQSPMSQSPYSGMLLSFRVGQFWGAVAEAFMPKKVSSSPPLHSHKP